MSRHLLLQPLLRRKMPGAIALTRATQPARPTPDARGPVSKALVYFALAEDRDAARAFIDAFPKKGHKTAQAQGWWQAALILRHQGMELTGYEMAPDFALYGGGYSWPYYNPGTGR